MANSATKVSDSLGTAAVNLTPLGGIGYYTWGSGSTVIQKIGGTGIISAEGWDYSTNEAMAFTAFVGGFGSSGVTTTDGTPADVTADTDCPYITANVPFGFKVTLSAQAGTQTVQIGGGINCASGAIPIQCKVYDASATLRLDTTLSGYTAGIDTDFVFELDINSDAAETWTIDVRTDGGHAAYDSYLGPRWLHISDVASVRAATLTGTITASTTETDVINGGKTIILTLTGDTWIA